MTKNVKKIIGFLYCLVFCTVVAVGVPQMARAEETFTSASGKSGDLEWNITPEGHLTVTGEGDYELVKFSENSTWEAPEWVQYYEYICTADINVKNITSTNSMFRNCRKLTSLDVSKLDTSNVTNMKYMFSSCHELTSLDLSKLDTSNVTDMRYMFSSCHELTSLDLSNFDTSNVTSMYDMFYGCGGLTSLDVSSFNTSNVTSMNGMFFDCGGLTSLDVSNFNTSNVTNMSSMFSDCGGLISLDLSNFNTSNVTAMGDNSFHGMFKGCHGLTSLDVSNFDTNNVTNMSYMFSGCGGLTSLDLSNFDTSNVTAMSSMFSSCSGLTSLDLSNFDTNNVTTRRKFSLSNLSALDKLYFFANASTEYTLPSSSEYRWIDEDNETCTVTAKLDRKMTYTRVDKDYVPSITPTPVPSSSPVLSSDIRIFSDYDYKNPVTGSAVVYGNGKAQTLDGKKMNNKVFTAYTDILASYKYTLNSKGIVKPSVGKVIVGVTKSDTKPAVNSKNKITDTSASKIAKAKIKNGQITVTAVGKEGGLVYLWVIDTGSKGISACCQINVKLAPTKLEVQNTSGSKIAKNTKLENGKTLDICVAGLVGQTKAEDGTYTATVASKDQSYVTVTPVEGSTNKFTINAKGLKNNKDTKVTVTFKCDQNGKKTNLSLTITK